MEIVGLLAVPFVAVLCAFVVGVPLAIYRVAARKNRASWDARLRVREARAYRDAPLEVKAPGRIPRLVSAASLVSLLAASFGVCAQAVALFPRPDHDLTQRELGWISLELASGVVGAMLTRRSYVVAALAATLAVVEVVAAPVAFAHAALLAAAAVVHVRATLRACA